MSAAIQIELIRKIVRDWALSDECSGVDALVAIMEILNYNPYEEQRPAPEVHASDVTHAATGD